MHKKNRIIKAWNKKSRKILRIMLAFKVKRSIKDVRNRGTRRRRVWRREWW